MAISLNYNHKIDFYINVTLTESFEIGGHTGNSGAIEIGRSLWGDRYLGYMSELALWDRALAPKEIKEVYNGKLKLLVKEDIETKPTPWLLIIVIAALLGAIVIALALVIKRKHAAAPSNSQSVILPKQNAFYFFGNFRAYNDKGEDISNEFSPTLIRLFSIILLYSKTYQRNINSTELFEALWPGDSPSQQKNSRSTNVHRLRNLFIQFDDISLVFNKKEWHIDSSSSIFIDILHFERIVGKGSANIPFLNIKLDKAIQVAGFESVLRLYNDERIKLLSKQCQLYQESVDWKRLGTLAMLWLTVDSLSDDAIKYQIVALIKLDQKQNALRAYNSFCENYTALLNEKYPLSFDKLISS